MERFLLVTAVFLRFSNAMQCERIPSSRCAFLLGYNRTSYPNLFSHESSDDAEESFRRYGSYGLGKCNSLMERFVCAAHYPVCSLNGLGYEPISPCRSFCEAAKTNCEDIVEQLIRNLKGTIHVDAFNCATYRPDDGQCMPIPEDLTMAYECPSSMKAASSSSSLHLQSGILRNCSLTCSPMDEVPFLLNMDSRSFLRSWIGGLAIASGLFGLFVLCTFLVNSERFSYPTRPLIYMSGSYLAAAVASLIGSYSDNTFSCGAQGPGEETRNYLVNQGGDFFLCSIFGALLYYFTFSAALWWLALCFCWFLSATRQWGEEAISRLSLHLKLVCWGLPAVGAVIALATDSVDGDVLSGSCSVGNLHSTALFSFVVYPLAFCLFLGVVFFLRAARSIVLLCRQLERKQPAMEMKHFRTLIFRLVLFTVFYVVVCFVSVGTQWYQADQMPTWLEVWYSRRCLASNRTALGFSSPSEVCPPTPVPSTQPELLFFLVKYLSQLCLGIVCAAWLINYKTFDGYRKALTCTASQRAATADSSSFHFKPAAEAPLLDGAALVDELQEERTIDEEFVYGRAVPIVELHKGAKNEYKLNLTGLADILCHEDIAGKKMSAAEEPLLDDATPVNKLHEERNIEEFVYGRAVPIVELHKGAKNEYKLNLTGLADILCHEDIAGKKMPAAEAPLLDGAAPVDEHHEESNIDEEFVYGRAVPIVELLKRKSGTKNESEKRVKLNQEGLKAILFREDIAGKKVALISIAGAFRKGKSFLLNFFVTYLEWLTNGAESQWLDENTVLDKFYFDGGVHRVTNGIFLWSKPFILKNKKGEDIVVLLMDTQGTFDTESTMKDSSVIFALSTLVSSLQILNISPRIQEDDLQNLRYFTEYARLAQSVDDGEQASFQQLLFLIRDWSDADDYAYGYEGGKEYLNEILKIKTNQQPQGKNLRVSIQSSFSPLRCFLMPHPGLRIAKNKFEMSGSSRILGEVEPEFEENLELFIPSVLGDSSNPLEAKNINGHDLTCSDLLELFKAYIKIFDSDKMPEPKTILDATADAMNINSLENAKNEYDRIMKETMPNDLSNMTELDRLQQEAEKACKELFAARPKLGEQNDSGKYEEKLEKHFEECYERFKTDVKSRSWQDTKDTVYQISVGLATIIGAVATGAATRM